MSFAMTCACGQQLVYEEQHLGKTVRCRACGHTFVLAIPLGPPADRSPPAEAEDVTPYRVEDLDDSPYQEEAPSRRRRFDDRAREEEAPRRRRRRSSPAADGPLARMAPFGRWLLWNRAGLVGMLMLAAIGVGLTGNGINEYVLSENSSATPQTLTLAQLIQRGTPGNAHVIVTDFVPADNYVFEYRQHIADRMVGRKPETAKWDKVYQPLLPAGAGPAGPGDGGLEPTSVQVVAISTQVWNKKDWERVFGGNQVQGMVVNSITNLDSETQSMLRKSYPQTDFTRCVLIRQGHRRSTASNALATLFVGAILLALALVAFGVALTCRFLDTTES